MRTPPPRTTSVLAFGFSAALLTLPQATLVAQEDQSTALIHRDAIVYSQTTGKTYAVDRLGSAVWVIDPTGAAKSVHVGAGPEAIAVNGKSGTAYVVSAVDRNVSVLDGNTDSVVATVPTAARPFAIAVDETANKVYVSNIFSDLLTVIDGSVNVASNLKAISADQIFVDKQSRNIYLLRYETDALMVLNATNGNLTRLPAGAMHLWALVLDSAEKTVFITHVANGTVAALNLESNQLKTISVGTIPCAIALNSKTHEVYVANYGDGTVTVLDAKSGHTTATVQVGKHPQALAIDETKNLVFVANTADSTVSIIGGKTHRVLKTVDAGPHPYALALDEKSSRVYVANLIQKPFTVLNADISDQ